MAVTHTCETLPADPKAAIRRIKQELRAQIGDDAGGVRSADGAYRRASGRD